MGTKGGLDLSPMPWICCLGDFFLRIGISQWLFLVPLKGGRWHIIPQLAVYTTYILPSGGLYATYHLLGELETTLEYLTQPMANF